MEGGCLGKLGMQSEIRNGGKDEVRLHLRPGAEIDHEPVEGRATLGQQVELLLERVPLKTKVQRDSSHASAAQPYEVFPGVVEKWWRDAIVGELTKRWEMICVLVSWEVIPKKDRHERD